MRAAGLCIIVILFSTHIAYAAELININTADVALLDTLPGIGSVIAERIISYRETNGLFASIQDIQKVSGIGSGVTYTKIEPLITVGETNTSGGSNTDTDGISSSTTTPSTPSSSGGSTAVYTPSPSTLTIDVGPPTQDATTEVPLLFSARVTTKGGTIDSSAQIVWGFGDGSSATASSVKKTYYYAGTYLVVVTAIDGLATARDEIVVTVRPVEVRILEVPGVGIMIMNDANERLDLSGWALFAEKKSFRIPNGTVILPKSSIILPSVITHLSTAPEVTLAYPDGSIAAQYVPQKSPVRAVVQPFIPSTSSNEKKVEPIISQEISVQKNEDAVSAPTAATDFVAVGAASPAASSKKPSPAVNLLKSPWTLGFLGTVILAGGAFILL
ncbi:MAG: helix-hairpin-helix domain-containing protein [Candidatus Paceibacterota bacterium]|jgi:competence ComEA-like helix-hairpin-helix protein